MEIKLLVLISLLITSSLGQDLTCTFENFTEYDQQYYRCILDIQNPKGFDNFTTIGGTHNEGRTNSDVTALFVKNNSTSTIIPQIICSQFPNLLYIAFSEGGVKEIHEHAVSGCRDLKFFYLRFNGIERIHPRALVNNEKLNSLNIGNNRLQTLDEDTFTNLRQLIRLELSNNPFISIPGGVFLNLVNLRILEMDNVNIDEVKAQWFSNLRNLRSLSLVYNKITYICEGALANLTNLNELAIYRNPIKDMSSGVFKGLNNLEELLMHTTQITTIRRGWFDGLHNLRFASLTISQIRLIARNAFDGLTSLKELYLNQNFLNESAIPEDVFDKMGELQILSARNNLIQTINPRWFQNLTSLTELSLSANSILQLPSRTFASLSNLQRLFLGANYIKTLSRNAFGDIENLKLLSVSGSMINAIDEKFLSEATALNVIYLSENICINTDIDNFIANRSDLMPQFELCMSNFRYTIDTETEVGEPYEFYEAPMSGIQFRVFGTEYIQIALSTTKSMTNPMLELHIGCEGNTMSRVIRNQTETVVSIQTPSILNNDMWNGFRVTWANNVIMMSRETAQYPFITHTMEDVFPVNFMGLRSPNSNAIWSVQPVQPDIEPAVKSNVPKIDFKE